MGLLRLPGGTKYIYPTKSFMMQDMDRMNRSFPPGIVINASTIPPCVAVALQAMGRGVIQVIKTWLNTQIALVDPIIALVKVYVFWLEAQQNIPEALAARAMGVATTAARTQYRNLLRQIQQGVGQNQLGAGNEAAKVVSDTIYGCMPLAALLRAVEEIARLPEAYLRKLMINLRTKLAIINNLQVLVVWLETRKRFYQAWINCIDISISTTQ